MPAVYGYSDVSGARPGHTSYFVFTGPDTALGKGDKPSVADITDGTSNTLLAVEARREVPWTKPEDIPFDPQVELPQLGGFTPEGFNAALLRRVGPVHPEDGRSDVLKALITRAGVR